jgi:hypothetical protein
MGGVTDPNTTAAATARTVPDRVTSVPRRLRIVCALLAVGIVAVMTVVAVLLKESTTGVVAFRTSDQVAMEILGLLIAAGVLSLGRPRVEADREGIVVRNVLTHRVPWGAVTAITFGRSAAWATLHLVHDVEIPLVAVQAADGERAAVAVEGLRALLAASREAGEQGE